MHPEGELSNVFKLLSDGKQKAGETIRNAWDSKPVYNLVAGKSDDGEHKSLLCKNPHISIIGSSTPALTKSTLPIGASTSGDGNRFIWCYTKRHQIIPRPPEPIEWHTVIIERGGYSVNLLEYLLDVVKHGKNGGKWRVVPLVQPAKKFWDALYLRMENDPATDFLGGMTSRAAAHIRRIATILALMDNETAVRVDHLKAAVAIWEYSLDSARYIFTACTLDQAKILRAAQDAGATGVTGTEVHKLFGNNKTAAWVNAQLKELMAKECLGHQLDVKTGHPTNRYQFVKWPKNW